MDIMRSCAAAAVLLLAAATAHAETVTWGIGRAIEVPVRVSTDTTVDTRTVIFLGSSSIKRAEKSHSDEDLKVKAIGNTLILKLLNPAIAANIQIVDDQDNLFTLRVTAATGPIDSELFVKRQEVGVAQGRSRSKEAVVGSLISHMISGRRMPGVFGAMATTIDEAGTVSQGKVIVEDDAFICRIERSWIAGSYRGYHCTLRSKGNRPFRADFQRLSFPGAIAVYCPAMILLAPKTPGVDGQAGGVIDLYYVAQQ